MRVDGESVEAVLKVLVCADGRGIALGRRHADVVQTSFGMAVWSCLLKGGESESVAVDVPTAPTRCQPSSSRARRKGRALVGRLRRGIGEDSIL